MHHFITGIAGFIGSQLADALVHEGHRVSGMDDLSLGRHEHLAHALSSGKLLFLEGNCAETAATASAIQAGTEWGGPIDIVWHMAANSDVAAGVADPTIDFTRTLQTTFSVIQAVREAGVAKVAFASTSAIYGERLDPLTEDSGPLLPISNYGATKLASEALLSAAAEVFIEELWMFRFPNVVGPRATHGAIYDFIARLKKDPSKLEVLGDGSQTKPYLHVSELIAAMQYIVENTTGRRNVFNIGPEGAGTSVAFIAEKTVEEVAPNATISFGENDRGWVGDVPRFSYSTLRLAELGWRPKLSSDQAVLRAIAELSGK